MTTLPEPHAPPDPESHASSPRTRRQPTPDRSQAPRRRWVVVVATMRTVDPPSTSRRAPRPRAFAGGFPLPDAACRRARVRSAPARLAPWRAVAPPSVPHAISPSRIALSTLHQTSRVHGLQSAHDVPRRAASRESNARRRARGRSWSAARNRSSLGGSTRGVRASAVRLDEEEDPRDAGAIGPSAVLADAGGAGKPLAWPPRSLCATARWSASARLLRFGRRARTGSGPIAFVGGPDSGA